MRITPRNDYSFLFNNLNSGYGKGSNMLGIDLSEYSSIKSGGYGKLLKSYYQTQAKDVSSSATDKKEKDTKPASKVTEYTKTANTADALKTTADKLVSKGTDSVFSKVDMKTTAEDGTVSVSKDYDKAAIYNAVKDFTDKYNDVIKSGKDSTSSSVDKQTDNMISLTSVYKNSLSNIGININEDNTLSIDNEKFNKADINAVKNLFNGNQSFAYQVESKAYMIEANANSEANSAKNYTSTGNYAGYDAYSVGTLLNSMV